MGQLTIEQVVILLIFVGSASLSQLLCDYIAVVFIFAVFCVFVLKLELRLSPFGFGNYFQRFS